jgi:hypothetical protein
MPVDLISKLTRQGFQPVIVCHILESLSEKAFSLSTSDSDSGILA